MKTRRELKDEVKALFRGRWRQAILMAIIPSILAFLGTSWQVHDQQQNAGNAAYGLSGSGADQALTVPHIFAAIAAGLGVGLLMFVMYLLVNALYNMFVISSQYSFLDWLRNPQRENHVVRDATSTFSKEYGWSVFGLTILINVYTTLWAILFIIPGIVKSFAYSQTFYVYKDMVAHTPAGQPKPSLRAAITRSRQLMVGHKMEYFVLQLSFIGWGLLTVISLGIGNFWLMPYRYATNADYYQNLVAQDRAASGINSQVA